jgi:glycosyltransferase involved in cell wall biosynthesis
MLASSEIPLNVGEFMIIDRRIADAILNTEDEYPYVRGLVAESFPSAKKISYTWERRVAGKSKSKPFDLIDQGINGLISTSRFPARFTLLVGFAAAFLGIILGVWTLLLNLFSTVDAPEGIPTIIVVLLFFGGLQLFFLGLIGEYVLSIHSQVKRKPPVFDI